MHHSHSSVNECLTVKQAMHAAALARSDAHCASSKPCHLSGWFAGELMGAKPQAALVQLYVQVKQLAVEYGNATHLRQGKCLRSNCCCSVVECV
mgnify:CR=1 FL=1